VRERIGEWHSPDSGNPLVDRSYRASLLALPPPLDIVVDANVKRLPWKTHLLPLLMCFFYLDISLTGLLRIWWQLDDGSHVGQSGLPSQFLHGFKLGLGFLVGG